MSEGWGPRLLGEAAGTAILVGVGTGAIVAAARVGGVPQAVLAVAWFAAVAIPIALFGRWSGAHLNPAVTLALVVAHRFPPRYAAPYVGAQVAGAFVGSAAVLGLLGSGAHLGATVPRGGNVALVVPLEFSFTVLLLLAVLVAVVRPTVRAALLLPPAAVGLATFVIGPWTGCSLNPARTLAPAVLSGDYVGLGAYLVAVPAAALVVGMLARRSTRAARRLDRSATGPPGSADRGAR
ncbi:MAG TPA: aquaporin [Thermoplasmata archaeon]|nr:aquaporin [Thermoplasmata archaeon]